MKIFSVLFCLSFLFSVCSAFGSNEFPIVDPNLQVKPDAYGPGIGMDQYGRPVQSVNNYNRNREENSNSQIEKFNGYGPGIHIDQYGRPVQVVPR